MTSEWILGWTSATASNDTIKALDNTKVYKYPGMIQNNTIKTREMRRSNQDEYFAWLKKIIKTSLNSKKPIDAVNTFTTPTISYGFAVLDWSVTELEAIDRETRKVLKKYHLLNNNSDVTRLYLPRRDGGRGLVNITHQYKSNCDVQLQLEKHRRSTFNTCVSFASPFTIQVDTRESSEIF